MSQPSPPAGWYADPANAQLMRYWDGAAWTDHTQPSAPVPPQPPAAPVAAPQAYTPTPQPYAQTPQPYAQAPQPYSPAPQGYGTPYQSYGGVPQRQFQITRYNQRMAARVARRAHLNEQAIAVAFTYNNLATMLIFGLIEDVAKLIPTIGEALEVGLSLFSFYFHRILIVTDRSVYVYRDWPLHYPGKQLAAFQRGPGVVQLGTTQQGWWSQIIRRGQLTFHNGEVVYHSPLWIRRAQYVAQEANIPPGQ